MLALRPRSQGCERRLGEEGGAAHGAPAIAAEDQLLEAPRMVRVPALRVRRLFIVLDRTLGFQFFSSYVGYAGTEDRCSRWWWTAAFSALALARKR